MKVQKSVMFVKKNLKINTSKIKKYRKVRDHCHYTGEYRNPAHSICNLKYSVAKQILVVFHNGSNYDYHFIIKELAEEFKKQFTCLPENTEKSLQFQQEKKLHELTNVEKLQKIYLTYYNLLTAQDLWQAHYQILSIIFLKEFIELNVSTDMMIKNVRLVELNISTAAVFLNTKILNMI